jgi:alpha-1,3-rhamnosyl/mannosyltransferase
LTGSDTLLAVRVGIDVSPLRLTRAGTARYLRGLLPELEARLDVVRLAFGGGGRATAAVRDAVWYPLGLGRAARRAGVGLLHCPSFRGPLRTRLPLVVTVHDLAVFRHPEAFNRWSRTYGRIAVPPVLRAARRVIAVSEFTRRELRELLGVPDDRIRVVPNGVGGDFTPEGPASPGDYVLAVGTLEPRKNLARLLDAVRRADVELRIVGARGWGGVEVAGNGVRWLGEVPDARLAELYRGAACLAYPSLYEGFGIPVLEAMACGTPVVTSVGGATEEVAGGAAVLVDPLDPDSIAAGLEEAASRRAELVPLGLERARAFTWADATAATVDVYREAGE